MCFLLQSMQRRTDEIAVQNNNLLRAILSAINPISHGLCEKRLAMGGAIWPPSVFCPVLYIQGCPFIHNITTLCTSKKCKTFYSVGNNFVVVSTIAFWWRHNHWKPMKMTFGVMEWRQVYEIWPNLPKILILLISKWHTSILKFRWVFVPI